jgi:hypothetical protein
MPAAAADASWRHALDSGLIKREHHDLGLRGHLGDCARALPAQPLDRQPPRVTVKVARSALRIPLALGERTGLGKRSWWQRLTFSGVALTPWPLAGISSMRVSPRLFEPRLSCKLVPSRSPAHVSIRPDPDPVTREHTRLPAAALPPRLGVAVEPRPYRFVLREKGRCAPSAASSVYPRKMVDIRVGVLVPLLPGCRGSGTATGGLCQ